jgi:hypothetical protein
MERTVGLGGVVLLGFLGTLYTFIARGGLGEEGVSGWRSDPSSWQWLLMFGFVAIAVAAGTAAVLLWGRGRGAKPLAVVVGLSVLAWIVLLVS